MERQTSNGSNNNDAVNNAVAEEQVPPTEHPANVEPEMVEPGPEDWHEDVPGDDDDDEASFEWSLWREFKEKKDEFFEWLYNSFTRAQPDRADHVYTPAQLKERTAELRSNDFVIDGLIPKQSLSLVVGDSGLGKSPLLYQAAICVAAGVPFLGKPVRKGRVLWIDCENGLGQVDGLLDDISRYLKLPATPEDLRLWNLNDAGEDFGRPGHQFEDLLKRHKPSWVIIDTLKTMFDGIESKNDVAIAQYKALRGLMGSLHCTITGVHHPRKTNQNSPVEALQTTSDPRQWFQEASGARSLITNCDVRVGVDKAVTANADLVVRGFERVNGEFPSMLLARVVDEATGDPIGYRLLTGVDGITNKDHRKLWNALPHEFRHKDAKAVYGKSDSALGNALNVFQAAQVLKHRKEEKLYAKLTDERCVET